MRWFTLLVTKTILEGISCKYLGIIIRSYLICVDQVNYTVQKAWKAINFVMRVLKKGNRCTRILAYKTFLRPITEHMAVCWNQYREREKCVIPSTIESCSIYSSYEGFWWGNVALRRKIARLCAFSKGILGSGLGKVNAIGCDVLNLWVRLIM